jgi:aldoxime dehydratase
MAGMKYLVENKQETGTLSLRIMTNLDDDRAERRETSVYAHFLSLAPLDQWAEFSPSHLAIYDHAIAKNRQYKQDRQFVSWHEVFVLPFGEFEYVNCHPRTGLLPYFQGIEIVR